MKRICISILGASLALMMGLPEASATNGYKLIGIGQLQRSMGGAVTAGPMSAMTAISNPAGLAVLDPRADFSIELFAPTRTIDFTETGGVSTDGETPYYGVPALGWFGPAFGSDKWFFGGGMYGTSGFGVDYGDTVITPAAAFGPGASDLTFNGHSSILFFQLAPALAYKVNEAFSIGASLSLDYQSVSLAQTLTGVPFFNDPTDPTLGITQRTIRLNLGRPTAQFGIGATIGVLFDVLEATGSGKGLVLGASYTTKQAFQTGKFQVAAGDIVNFNGALGLGGEYGLSLDTPQTAAFGVSYQITDMIRVAADVKWINWSSTFDEIPLTGPDGAFDTDGNPLNGGESSETTLNAGWDDQIILAAGIEVTPIDGLAVRTGVNWGEAPLDEADVFNNLLFPALTELHWALGVEAKLGPKWGIAATYTLAFENSITGTGDVPEVFTQIAPFQPDSNFGLALSENIFGVQLTYDLTCDSGC